MQRSIFARFGNSSAAVSTLNRLSTTAAPHAKNGYATATGAGAAAATATASSTNAAAAAAAAANHSTQESGFDYEGLIDSELQKKRLDKSYRYFNNINRLAKEFP